MDLRYNVLYNASMKDVELTEEEINKIVLLYHSEGKDEICKNVTKKKVIPFVASLLSKLNLDPEFWKEKLDFYRQRNERIINNLDLVYQKMADFGVHKMFVSENFGAMLSADSDKALFASGDVDNYADISEKEKIYAVFTELGYKIEERYSFRQLISTSFSHSEEFKDGFYFVIGWHPLSRMKLPCFVNADDFIDWTTLQKYGQTHIMLPPDNALMYICLLHISLHSFSRAPDIRLYRDIVNMSVKNVDWLKIKEWAMRDHTCNRLSTAAYLSHKLTCIPVPNCVLSMTNRPMVKRLLGIIYDKTNNTLIYEPPMLLLLIIEFYCFDNGILRGIKSVFLPDYKWVHDKYGKNMLMSYRAHWNNLV